MSRAWMPTCESPISPPISARLHQGGYRVDDDDVHRFDLMSISAIFSASSALDG